MEIVTISLIALGVLVLMLSFGVALPYCFGGALMTMCLFGGATMKGTMVWGFSQLANPVLLCIPLFVFAGTVMSESGIAASLPESWRLGIRRSHRCIRRCDHRPGSRRNRHRSHGSAAHVLRRRA